MVIYWILSEKLAPGLSSTDKSDNFVDPLLIKRSLMDLIKYNLFYNISDVELSFKNESLIMLINNKYRDELSEYTWSLSL